MKIKQIIWYLAPFFWPAWSLVYIGDPQPAFTWTLGHVIMGIAYTAFAWFMGFCAGKTLQ